jgi:two-component system, LuxR family, sensor kinase FixL
MRRPGILPAEAMDCSPLDILVIDDDADARENLRDILELDDHCVVTAGSAAEAMAREDWARFPAIILDRRLPDATAEQLMPRLKAAAPDAAVIVVTGYSDLQGVIAALRQGASDYILKPLNADLLRTSLARIAERRQLAVAKERSEATFRHLVEAAECMIVILRPDHTIVYFSPFAEQLTGYSAAEVHGRSYLELLLPDAERQRVAAEFGRIITGHPTRGFENAVACWDGSRRSMVWNARYLADYENGPAILKVGQDITFLKQAQERALQAERLAAIGEMVAGLAHESRNALQRSQACLEMLALVVRDRPEAIDLINRIQRAQDHLHTLYEDVRGYAAPIQLRKASCDLKHIWREAWNHLEPARAEKQATLVEATDRTELSCIADPFRLEQVFGNILDNALAAGSCPVAVEVRAEEVDLLGESAIRIAIHDDGPGIPAERRPKVFDPFFTTKARGTGLGMPIAKRIVEAHGGRISIGNDDKPGTTFLITLPRGSQ